MLLHSLFWNPKKYRNICWQHKCGAAVEWFSFILPLVEVLLVTYHQTYWTSQTYRCLRCLKLLMMVSDRNKTNELFHWFVPDIKMALETFTTFCVHRRKFLVNTCSKSTLKTLEQHLWTLLMTLNMFSEAYSEPSPTTKMRK